VTNEGTVSASASAVDANGRKVVPLPERAERKSKKRLASTAFVEDDHSQPLPPLLLRYNFHPGECLQTTRPSSSNLTVPLKDDASSNFEESGRSRRQRSSVNYAERRLKSKMHKPRVEDPTGLKTRKTDGDGLGVGYNSDGTGLTKERVKREKSTKG